MSKKTYIGVLVALAVVGLVAAVVYWPRGGDTSPKLRVGVILPITGSAAEIAHQHRMGIELAVQKINGDPKTKVDIEAIYEDDGNDPKQTVSAFNKLAHVQKVPIVLTVMSGPSMAVKPLTERNTVILFANCGLPTITEGTSWVFRNFPSSSQEVKAMLLYAKDVLKLNSIAVLCIDDAYGIGAASEIERSFPSSGIRVVSSERYAKDGTDFRAQISKVRASAPQALYVFGYGKATANVVIQACELGFEGIILGSYNFNQPPLTTVAGAAIEGAYYTLPNMPSGTENSSWREFAELFKSRYGQEPSWNAAIDYDAVHLISAAVRHGGTAPDRLRQALESVGDYGGVLGTYKWSATREWLCPMVVMHIKAGKHMQVYP